MEPTTKSICLKIAAFFFLLISLATSALADDWVRLASGLHYRTIDLQKKTDTANAYKLHVFKVNPHRFDIRPILAGSANPLSAQKLAEKSGALIALNANFFDPQARPLGLVVKDGKVLNPFRDISWWGIFYIHDGRAGILGAKEYNPKFPMNQAVQAGPRLIIGKGIPKLKASNTAKTVLGLNRKGEVFIAVTLYPVEITELAKLMAKNERQGGLECTQALNLDGGHSSQLYARIGNFELKLPSYVNVPVGLGVFPKP